MPTVQPTSRFWAWFWPAIGALLLLFALITTVILIGQASSGPAVLYTPQYDPDEVVPACPGDRIEIPYRITIKAPTGGERFETWHSALRQRTVIPATSKVYLAFPDDVDRDVTDEAIIVPGSYSLTLDGESNLYQVQPGEVLRYNRQFIGLTAAGNYRTTILVRRVVIKDGCPQVAPPTP